MRDESSSCDEHLLIHNPGEVIKSINGEHKEDKSKLILETESTTLVEEGFEKSVDEEFVNEYSKMIDEEEKVNDAWLNSLKTSENDDTQVVYEAKGKENEEKSEKMDILYELPKVEVIRLLVSKLEDGQSPSDYIKTYDSRDKTDEDEDSPYEVSDLAHVLTMSWKNVYFMTKDEIVEALMNYKNNNKEQKTYEFRWVRDELAVHGPYQHEDILMWIVYGYVSEENPILVRELNEEGNPITLEWQNYKDSDIFNIFSTSDDGTGGNEDSSKKEAEEEKKPGFEFMYQDGYATRKRQKLLGLKVKEKHELY
ncbi:uncharacterized protein TOT_040000160 [Theileria orientalis strain Shintoku]|uniref:GYF domain-containing protein n=1 Tax=Theileria orientalis strain Shintoku TaxID=869250 RepID=J4C921_THEOR|nr:uncharacterized protein TOT_040000160 [Theileria orientalis strain Shintoku]BAM41778.1 uncharacterized protein TOT_040000160 [Theileria orientalis strain Shintoku]|eukprot:XP_009692079.1 uncharacterized protein TOT_040000160 [Theileria orientalis strain Shintoku]